MIRAGVATAVAVILVAGSPSSVRTQEASARLGVLALSDAATPDRTMAASARRRVAELVAIDWAEPVSRVHVEILGPAVADFDSLSVDGGSGERWIVAFWSEGESVRRFAKAGLTELVPVATRDLERKQQVEGGDFTMQEAIAWGPPDAPLPDPTGMVVERVISAGEILRSPAVRPPLFVRGGQRVEALLMQPGVVMRLQAEALSSAREGERVLLRLASGLRTEGTAVAPGLVELTTGGAR